MTQQAIDRATAEFYAAKKLARATRRAFAASPDAGFVRTMQGAITQYLQAREQGIAREDAVKGLELELRGAWPKGVSKFTPACTSCDDTGYIDHACWEGYRCGREVCAKNPERQHAFVEPCGCARGDKMRSKVRTTEDAIAAAGRTAKRKPGWKQVGS